MTTDLWTAGPSLPATRGRHRLPPQSSADPGCFPHSRACPALPRPHRFFLQPHGVDPPMNTPMRGHGGQSSAPGSPWEPPHPRARCGPAPRVVDPRRASQLLHPKQVWLPQTQALTCARTPRHTAHTHAGACPCLRARTQAHTSARAHTNTHARAPHSHVCTHVLAPTGTHVHEHVHLRTGTHSCRHSHTQHPPAFWGRGPSVVTSCPRSPPPPGRLEAPW